MLARDALRVGGAAAPEPGARGRSGLPDRPPAGDSVHGRGLRLRARRARRAPLCVDTRRAGARGGPPSLPPAAIERPRARRNLLTRQTGAPGELSTAEPSIEAARALEASGDIDAAVAAYVRAGAVREATRVLVDAGRYAEAGSFLLSSLGASVQDAGRLRGAARRAAFRAAKYFELGEEPELATLLYESLGDDESAARVRGAPSPARQSVQDLLDSRGGFAAAEILSASGRKRDALQALLEVGHDDPAYRAACMRAIALSEELDLFDFDVDRLVASFSQSPPGDAAEADAMCTLARLYEQQDYLPGARRVLAKVLEHDPEHAGATRLLAAWDRPPDDPPPRPASARPTGPPRRSLAAERRDSDLPTMDASETRPPEAAPSLHGVHEGDLLANRFLLHQIVGRGGGSVVFRALDRVSGAHVALKVIPTGPSAPRRFQELQREVTLAPKLRHERVATVYEAGTFPSGYWASMELLEGHTIKELLGQHGPLPVSLSLGYLVQACDALAHVHERGVVHRDVKPSNLFVTRRDVLKLTDFGIAHAPGSKIALGTRQVLGTPEYMSPEQLADPSSVTPASDLYSLGVSMYEMFTGQRPFVGDSVAALEAAHREHTPEPPTAVCPQMPAAMERIILRLLAKDPAERVDRASDLARGLRIVHKALR